MSEIPSYDDLPAAPNGGRTGWGMFGPDDNVGRLNLQGADQVRAGAGLVRRGAVFALNAPLDAFTPALSLNRGVPRPKVIHRAGGFRFDDVIDNFYPQASSQWDSLAHVGYGTDLFYNGATEDDILAGRRNTIEHWAKRGIAGRGVVLDLARALAADGRAYNPGESVAFSVDDLELARTRAGVEYRSGDVILLHTGFAAWYGEQSEDDRVAMPRQLKAPGIEHSEAMARYLWDSQAAALATDTFAVEVWPADLSEQAVPFGFLHQVLIGLFGIALGELFWLDDLAADCAADGVYETMFVSAPLHSVGGIGSPPNALAIK
jgi:kynurenine formamidase